MKKDIKGTSPYRTRHLMIYTFLLILVLLYFASRQQRLTMEAQQKVEDAKKREEVQKSGKEKEEAGASEGNSSGGSTGDSAGSPVTDAGENTAGNPSANGADTSGTDPGKASDAGLVLNKDEMWSLVLTNESHPVPENIQVKLKVVDGTPESVDERVYDPLMKMLNAMKEQGMDPIVCSGYRTKEKQEELFQQQIQEYIAQGHPQQEAEELAKKDVSVPESGEHRLGLAVDIYSGGYLQLDLGFADTPEGIWLRDHASEYGFILRYQQGKEAQTGINYEPWHFRYVGVKAAEYMKEHDMCLEEFYIDQGLYG